MLPASHIWHATLNLIISKTHSLETSYSFQIREEEADTQSSIQSAKKPKVTKESVSRQPTSATAATSKRAKTDSTNG